MNDHGTDDSIRSLLNRSRVIALVGASAKPHRDSHRVMEYLLQQGHHVIPVNPMLAGSVLLGQDVVASMAEINIPIDIVDIFRNSKDADHVVDEAIAVGAGAVWMQLGVINIQAAQKAARAGLHVVMDRCPAIEIPRLNIRL